MSNWSFIEHATDYLARPRLGDQKAPTQWPSEATAIVENEHGDPEVIGKCRRSAYFRLLLDAYSFSPNYEIFKPLVDKLELEKIEVDPYMRWIWAAGNLYEDFCVNIAKEAGVFISGQTQIYVPKINLSGKIDLVVINPSDKLFHIVEVKSVYGFNANRVLGTPAERKRGILGTPRESHLMQLGLYQWWYANQRDEFGDGLLVYGARDTGRYAEYTVTVEPVENEDGSTTEYIFYKGNAPCKTAKRNSGISIQSIVEQYKLIAKGVDSGEIPERDFDLRYDEDKLQVLFDRGELSKKDTEQFEKRKKQIEEGKSRVVKQVEKGDWQCNYCSFKNVCYSEDKTPRNI